MGKLRKVSFKCVSLVLVITSFINNIFAMEPKIDEVALIATFREKYHEKKTGSDGFCTNPSDAYYGEEPLCYIQKAGKYKGEKREVYVWNLIAASDPGMSGICGILLRYNADARHRLDKGTAYNWIKWGEIIKEGGQAAVLSGLAPKIIREAAKVFKVTPEKLVSWFKQGMDMLGVEDGGKFADILSKGFKKISTKFPNAVKYVPHLEWGVVALGSIAIAVGVVCIMEGVAKINEDARNVADSETIAYVFLELIINERYKNANILVMAKDVSKLHFLNWDKRGEPPFVGFWRHNGLCEYGAPVFDEAWLNSSTVYPKWAEVFIENLTRISTRLGEKGDVKGSLDAAKDDLVNAAKKSLKALKCDSRYAIEDDK